MVIKNISKMENLLLFFHIFTAFFPISPENPGPKNKKYHPNISKSTPAPAFKINAAIGNFYIPIKSPIYIDFSFFIWYNVY